MEWQETTAINPSAWSDQVENDLAMGLCTRLGIELVEEVPPITEDAEGNPLPVPIPQPPKILIARETVPGFMDACQKVRKALAKAKGPQIVTVKSDGSAVVVPDTDFMSDEDRQAYEDRMEALRVHNSTEEQIKRAETTPEEAAIRDKILDEVAQSSENVPIEIVRDRIESAIVAHRQGGTE